MYNEPHSRNQAINVIVNKLLVAYAESGDADAPVILMFHGWGVSGQNFDDLAARLSVKFRVIRLDLPGFGGSERPPAAWKIHDYAVFVQQFVHKLEIPELAAVLGHSFGGRIAIKGLAEGLIPARQVILLDSAGLKPAGSPRRQAYAAAAKTGKAVLRLPGLRHLAPALRRRLYQSAGSSDYMNSGDMKPIFLNAINEDLSADAAHITVPALLIWGAADTDTPPSDGRTLANLIPHSSLSIVAGAGHFVHTDAPDRVAALITGFLS